MASRRRILLVVILSTVTGLHFVIIWLLMNSHQLVVKTRSGSLQLVRLPRPALLDAAPEWAETAPKSKPNPARNHSERKPAPSSLTAQSNEASNAIRPMPDWNEELQLAAQNAVANQLAQKGHDLDFAHAFPTAPQKPAQFAWDYAATHRVEAIPGGGMLVHLSDNCVLIIFPLPFIGCGIGKRPANGDLFERPRDK